MKKFHLKFRAAYDQKSTGEIVYRCGLRRPIGNVQSTDGLKLCARCEDSRISEDLRMEKQAEELATAGFLEPDMGPNRQYNEY